MSGEAFRFVAILLVQKLMKGITMVSSQNKVLECWTGVGWKENEELIHWFGEL